METPNYIKESTIFICPRMTNYNSSDLQHCILLRVKLITNVVILHVRATMCFSFQCNNVARQVEEKCCPYYRNFKSVLVIGHWGSYGGLNSH